MRARSRDTARSGSSPIPITTSVDQSRYIELPVLDQRCALDLGYQPMTSKLAGAVMQGLGDFLGELDAIKEGDGTLLDHSLVFAYTDTSNAKLHAVDGIPIILAGSAGGRMKTGIHYAGASTSVARVGLTVQQAMGLSVDHWGTASNMTNKPVSEILV